MNDMNLIHGRNICAMVNDAINYFALNGDNITMESLYDFLKEKDILTDNQKVASVADAR